MVLLEAGRPAARGSGTDLTGRRRIRGSFGVANGEAKRRWCGWHLLCLAWRDQGSPINCCQINAGDSCGGKPALYHGEKAVSKP